MAPRLPHRTPVYLTSGIRRIEALASERADPLPLMERAGLAAAELARDLIGDSSKPVLVVAGPGNNGGDAFVIARHLKRWWFNVHVCYAGDESKLSTDAAEALRAWRDAGGTTHAAMPDQRDWALVVDGLFGIGLQREISGQHASLVASMNSSGAPILAVDIPSGLESDTGRVLGCAVRAAHTVTFIGLKPGLLTLDGPDHSGELHLATLGVDASALVAPRGSITGREIIEVVLPQRALNTHKGTYGSVGIVGGARGMVGAAVLAGRAALKLGAGRVYVGLLGDDAPAVDLLQLELMLRAASDVYNLDSLTCIAAGPGLSQSAEARAVLARALEFNGPIVLDADALNLIASDERLRQTARGRSAPTLMTPHPAEAARLLDCATGDVQRDRVSAACKLAQELNAGVVLKGAGSVCAWPDDTWTINTSGNPGMASAGMGDVLSGIIAALLAQGADARLALQAGVYLHGAAADALVAAGTGPVGLTAGELADAARGLLNGR